VSEISRRRFLKSIGSAGALGAAAGAGLLGDATPGNAAATADVASRATIVRSGDRWTLENDVLRVGLRLQAGSAELTSVYNKQIGREYLTGPGQARLFSHQLNGSATVTATDAGWSIGAATVAELIMHTVDGTAPVGRSLTVTLSRQQPWPLAVTLVFELYDGRAGLRFYSLLRNGSGTANLTITRSTVISLNYPNDPHTIYYPPNAIWRSTTGPLSPLPADTSSSGKRAERPKKAITVYDSGDGWSVSPELNWKTQQGNGNHADYMLPPFAGIDAWYSGTDVAVVTNPESLQLVLFPGEQFEYLSVNLTVFAGDVIDAKMADQEHFRKRFRFNHVSTMLDTNDWAYRGGPGRVLPDDYYYTTIIPKAKAAGIDMVMLDDLWNTTRDTIVPSADMARSIGSLDRLSATLAAEGLAFGLWFDLTGDAANKGRDLADPANLAYKRSQIETLLTRYRLTHHMIDLTEYWQNESVTAYSHPSDNVYRKAVLVRSMLNDLVAKYPQYLPKLTSELDIFPTQGDRNVGLIHLPHNGWNTPNGGVTGEDLSLRTAITCFGHLPMEATYTGGSAAGTMMDHYALMACRNVKFADDPGDPAKWPEAGIARLARFNAWRKSPRIRALTEEVFRPVYLGTGWDGPAWNSSSGPYVWMFTDEARGRALLIATAKGGHSSTVVATLRWLADATTYAIADITLDDDGTRAYAYRGTATGAQLKSSGFPIDLTENTAPGKAFWVQAMSGELPQLLYLDENIRTATLTATGDTVTVDAQGTPGATTAAIVVDPHRDLAATATVRLDAAGRGTATVRAADLRPPVPMPVVFPEPLYSEAELLPYTTGPGLVPAVVISEGNASNGSWILAQCTAVGQYIEYSLDVPSDGMYRVDVRYKENQSRGKSQLQLDGAAFGPEVNHFYPAGMYQGVEFRERYLGNQRLAAGRHSFRFVATGTSGTSYQVGVDYLKLTPTATLPPHQYEAESLPSTAAGSTATLADPAASPAQNGACHLLKATGAGNWVEYTVAVPAPGAYRIVTSARCTAAGGQAQLSVDGAAQGDPLDQYLAPSLGTYRYQAFDAGVHTFAAAGAHTFRYTVTGRNAASTGYGLATDYLTLTPAPALHVAGPAVLPAGRQARITVDYVNMDPYYSEPKYLFWAVTAESAAGVATVDQQGVVTAGQPGTATITVRSQITREATATLNLTVT